LFEKLKNEKQEHHVVVLIANKEEVVAWTKVS